jgi:hypothetical protein
MPGTTMLPLVGVMLQPDRVDVYPYPYGGVVIEVL